MIHRMLAGLLLALGLAAAAPAAADPGFPTRPIRLLVAYPSGGAVDTVSRALAEEVSRTIGQPVVVENRPGAGGRIATELLANSPADGYTLLATTGAPITVAPALTSKLAYTMADLTPLVRVGEILNVMLVSSESGVKSVSEFVDWAKRQGRPIMYGSAGVGSADHLAGELFRKLTGVPMTHVPYKGGAAALQDLVGGQVDVGFSTFTVARPFVAAGKLRQIAVTSAERQASLPELPAVAEAVPGFAITNWAGVFAPRALPETLTIRLFEAFRGAAMQSSVSGKLVAAGVEPSPSASVDDFRAFVSKDAREWSEIVTLAEVPRE